MTDHNHVITVTPGTGTIQEEAANYELAKIIGDFLHHKYTGYLWRVNADIVGGVVNILCADVSMEYGCTIKTSQLTDPVAAEKLVLRMGAEILERARLNRGAMVEREVLEAKRDLRGNITNLN